ncbi:hypothetical protein VNO77_19824 [Canavalia gladiata]|uniref:GTP-eEF1A C-terminal domain-containing protein n=1 Tax=Canavalia gladiata TaxID=3824 RepID=A0AAN9LS95_CANGL
MLDKLEVERERRITNDIALWKFETTKYYCTIIDAPYIVASSRTGSLEHPRLAVRSLFPIPLLVALKWMTCCCNKMDVITLKYSKAIHDEFWNEVSPYMKKVGYNPDKVLFVPISGLEGDNMVGKSTNLDWYKGPTFLEGFGQINEPERPSDRPLRLPLQDVDKISDIGTIPVEHVETSALKPGVVVTFNPTGLTIENAVVRDLKRGSVASNSKDVLTQEAANLLSQVSIMNYPGLGNGYALVLDHHTSHIAVKFVELVTEIDKRSGEEFESEPEFLKKGDTVCCKVISRVGNQEPYDPCIYGPLLNLRTLYLEETDERPNSSLVANTLDQWIPPRFLDETAFLARSSGTMRLLVLPSCTLVLKRLEPLETTRPLVSAILCASLALITPGASCSRRTIGRGFLAAPGVSE